MFKPTTKIKKLLNLRKTRVLIFQDGLFVVEERFVKLSKTLTHKVEIYHYIKNCPIQILATEYAEGVLGGSKRVEIKHVETKGQNLYYGLEGVYIDLNNSSTSAKEKGLICNAATFVTPDEIEIREIWIWGALTGETSIHPDPTSPHRQSYGWDSAEAFYQERRHQDSFEIYEAQ